MQQNNQAHSWHNLKFANNGQLRGQSMMQLNAGNSSAVSNALISSDAWAAQQGNSTWDPLPMHRARPLAATAGGAGAAPGMGPRGGGVSSSLLNNPLFAGMQGAMNRSAAARNPQAQQMQGNKVNTSMGLLSRTSINSKRNEADDSTSSPQQHQAKRLKTVSFASLNAAAAAAIQDRKQQQQSPLGQALFPSLHQQQQTQQHQQQQRSLAHAAQSTPNFSMQHQQQGNNMFLNPDDGGGMQNASFQIPAQAARPNPFLAQLHGYKKTSASTSAGGNDTQISDSDKSHQFASIFDDMMQSNLMDPPNGDLPSISSFAPSQNRPAPSGSSFKYGYASTFAQASASNPKLLFAAIDGCSLLHNSCKLYPDTAAVVESAIAMDPDAVRRPISIVCCTHGVVSEAKDSASDADADSSSCSSNKPAHQSRKQRAQERFHYPINIALKYDASYEIIALLAQSGPDVIALPDGPDRCTALATAIALDRDASVIELLLTTNPEAAQVCDRHSNTPLHAAISRVSKPSLQVVQLVYQAYPKALYEHNFQGETPLDAAVRSAGCSEEVLNYFQSHRDGDLQENLQDDLV
jgi:hypothetical protein